MNKKTIRNNNSLFLFSKKFFPLRKKTIYLYLIYLNISNEALYSSSLGILSKDK